MAFVFVPNADGGFDEGDRQTNTDTGVEYIYVSGAWRALGPKIEDSFDTLDDRYVNKTGDMMTGDLAFGQSTTTNKDFVKFLNDRKANQTSVLRISRPYDGDNGVNTDGSTQAKGVGGLDIKIMANSDQNRLRILTGSSAAVETLKITGGGNGRQISTKSSIELNGGTNELQTIIAGNGTAGHLSYSAVDENSRRLSWGSTKVWILRQLDLVMNSIINVSGFIMEHANSNGKKFIIKGETAGNSNTEDFFYSYKNSPGTLDAVNYNGKMDSNANIVNRKFVTDYVADALDGADFDSYVKKAGDTMTGHLSFDLAGIGVQFKSGDTLFGDLKRLDNSTFVMRAENSKNFKIQARDTNGSSRTFFDAQTNLSSGSQGSDSGYRCKIYHLADPTNDYHAANQRYVKAEDAKRVEGRFVITNAGGNYYIQPSS